MNIAMEEPKWDALSARHAPGEELFGIYMNHRGMQIKDIRGTNCHVVHICKEIYRN